MKNGKRDDEVGSALRKLFTGDDPGEAFDRKVLAGTEAPGGGEHEISALDGDSARRGRWWLLAPLAAAAVILILVFGTGTGDDPVAPNIDPILPEEEAGMHLAGPGEEGKLLLPFSEKGTDGPDPMVTIRVDGAGRVSMDGETVTIQALAGRIRNKAGATPESDVRVTIVADRRAGWRTIQWVMQACASAKLHRLSFAVEKPDGSGTAALPVPLPHDQGIDSAPLGAGVVLKLARAQGEKTTRVTLLNRPLGVDYQGIDLIPAVLSGAVLAGANIGGDHRIVEIKASPSVPHAQVVRAIDKLLGAGVERILFEGAPPPPDIIEDTPASPVIGFTLRHRAGRTEVRVAGGDWKPFPPDESRLRALVLEFRRVHPAAKARVDTVGEVPPKAVAAMWEALVKAHFTDHEWVEGEIEEEIIEEEVLRDGVPARRSVRVKLRRKGGETFLDIETSRTVRMEGNNPVVNTKTSSARLEEGLEVLRGLLRELTGGKLRLRGVLAAESEVPFGDAKKVMRVFEEFGIDDIAIETEK